MDEKDRNQAISMAVALLLFFGAIGLSGWFFFGQPDETNVSILKKIGASQGIFFFFIYGGAVIPACLFALGVFGAVKRTTITILLSGLSLVVMGAWYIGHNYMLNEFVKPYGYSGIVRFSNWTVIGILQVFLDWDKSGDGLTWKNNRGQTTVL